jgi:hypothetical protein
MELALCLKDKKQTRTPVVNSIFIAASLMGDFKRFGIFQPLDSTFALFSALSGIHKSLEREEIVLVSFHNRLLVLAFYANVNFHSAYLALRQQSDHYEAE